MYRNLRPWLRFTVPAVEGGSPPAGDPPKDPEGDEPLGDAGKKALAAERRTAAAEKRRADELDARLKQFEEAQLSEQEKVTKRAAEAEARATEAQVRAMRMEAAYEAGLPRELVGRLQGSTPEELLEDAKSLKSLFGDGTPPRKGAAPDPSLGGGKPTKTAEEEQVRQQLARLGVNKT